MVRPSFALSALPPAVALESSNKPLPNVMSAVQVLSILGGAEPSSVRPPMLMRALAMLRSHMINSQAPPPSVAADGDDGAATSPDQLIALDAVGVLLRLLRVYRPAADDVDEDDATELAQAAQGTLDVLAYLLSTRGGCTALLATDGVPVFDEILTSLQTRFDADITCATFTCASMFLSFASPNDVATFVPAMAAPLVRTFQHGCVVAHSDRHVQLMQSGLTCILLLMQHQLDARESPLAVVTPAAAAAHSALTNFLCSESLLVSLVTTMERDLPAHADAHWKYCVYFARRCELLKATQSSSEVSRSSDLADSRSLQRLIASIVAMLTSAASSELLTQALATLHALCISHDDSSAFLCSPPSASTSANEPSDATGSRNSRKKVTGIDGLATLVGLMRNRAGDEDVQLAILRLLNTLLVQRSSESATSSSSSSEMSLASLSLDVIPASSSSSSPIATTAAASTTLHSRLLSLDILPLLLVPFAPTPLVATPAQLDTQCLSLYAFGALFLSGRWLGEHATPLDVTRESENAAAEFDSSAPHTAQMLLATEQLFVALLRLQVSAGVEADARANSSLPTPPGVLAWAQAMSSTLYVLGGCRHAAEHLVADGAIERVWTAITAITAHPQLVAPLLVFLLRVGCSAGASVLAPELVRTLASATAACERLFEAFPDDEQLSELVADTMLLAQGKAKPPIKYRA